MSNQNENFYVNTAKEFPKTDLAFPHCKPTWFSCHGEMFLVSAIISVKWNAPGKTNDTYKTQVSLINGDTVDIIGEQRLLFARQCYNLDGKFKDDFCNSEILFN